jgi:hypothetical protein
VAWHARKMLPAIRASRAATPRHQDRQCSRRATASMRPEIDRPAAISSRTMYLESCATPYTPFSHARVRCGFRQVHTSGFADARLRGGCQVHAASIGPEGASRANVFQAPCRNHQDVGGGAHNCFFILEPARPFLPRDQHSSNTYRRLPRRLDEFKLWLQACRQKATTL